MSNTTRRVRRVDATLRESQRRRATRSRALRTGVTTQVDAGELSSRGPRPQRSKTWMVGALVLAFVLAGVGWHLRDRGGSAVDTAAPAAVVEVFLGQASGGTPGGNGLLPLTVGSTLAAGDVAETGARSAEVSGIALQLSSGPAVRIDQGSRIQLVSDSVVTLDRGAVYVDSRQTGDAIEVRTTLGVVRDIGTQFEVRLVDDDVAGLRVRVREGRIDLEAGGEHHEAGVGEQLTQFADGELVRETISIHGPEWDWALSSAAVPQLEGLSLTEFLEWFAREGGWTLEYADPTDAERARETILHGTSDGLSAREAADLVFLGSGLSYRIDPEGRLEVSAATSDPS